MKTFILKVLIFSIPLILFFTPIYLFLRLTGENFYSIDSNIQSDTKYLIGYAYNGTNYRYLKWKSIIEKNKQDVWALGSSRVLQFRDNMFDSSFYNSGYTISSVSDFLPFLESIPKEKYPKLLILGLDQWMFNPNWDNLIKKNDKQYWKSSFTYYPASNVILSIIMDLLKGKYKLSVISKRDGYKNGIIRIGLNALVNSIGFRNDGSIYYGDQIKMLLNNNPAANDFGYSDTFSRIKNGNRRFEYGTKSNDKAFLELKEVLRFCSANNIYVVGFIPPFASKVNQKMINTHKYGYITSISPKAKPIFENFNFEFWDMTNLETYNSSDSETIDGFHGGELTYLKMLIYMVKNDSILGKYTNERRLEKDILNKKNRYIVYDY